MRILPIPIRRTQECSHHGHIGEELSYGDWPHRFGCIVDDFYVGEPPAATDTLSAVCGLRLNHTSAMAHSVAESFHTNHVNQGLKAEML